MKTNSFEYAGAPKIALCTGLAVGLGIVVHNVFFLIATMIALSIPFGWLINWVREAEERPKTGFSPIGAEHAIPHGV